MAVFQGAQAYISPSWYPTKRAHGKVVPTWNYAVVHAHGVPRAIESRDEVLAIVTRLTQIHEADSAVPWEVSDAPADYIEQMLKAIVGIEMPDRAAGSASGRSARTARRPIAWAPWPACSNVATRKAWRWRRWCRPTALKAPG